MTNKHKIIGLSLAAIVSAVLFFSSNQAQAEWCPALGCYSDRDANYCIDAPQDCNNEAGVYCRYTGEATCANPGGLTSCGARYECVQESPPPPPVCEDSNASNYGGSLPCQYPPPPICQDSNATNYGGSLPCQYPPPQVCGDPNASNYGGSLPCQYPPPPICQDPNASNYGGWLPCTYPPPPPPPPETCGDPNASNYGGNLPCHYPPPPPVGNISVTSNLPTTWCLSGPDSFCGSGTSGYYPGHNVGGYTISMNAIGDYSSSVSPAQTQGLGNGGTITFNITYNANPVLPPSNLTVDNTVCSKLKLTWQDNSNNEDGFIIRRSVSSGAESEIARVGANQTTFMDTPPAVDAAYYYIITAYKNSPAQQTSSNETNGFNQGCIANLSNSSKSIQKINGEAYSSFKLIRDGDVLTFRIVIANTGPATAVITKITDFFSPTLVDIRNLNVSGGNDGGITRLDATTVEFNVTGNKTAGNPNWIITFDATVKNSVPAGSDQMLFNRAVIHYTDGEGAKSYVVKVGPILYKGGPAGGLNFREIAP